MIKLLRNLHLGVCAIVCLASAALLLAISYSSMADIQRHPHIACLHLLFPLALAIVCAVLAYTLALARKLCWIPLACLLACWPVIRKYTPFHLNSEIPENGTIKILTYNVMAFDIGDLRKKGDRNDILQYILDSGADIVCLQECRAEGRARKTFYRRLASVYPYICKEAIDGGYDYLAILSRHPILSYGQIRYKSRANGSMEARIKVGEDTLLVINNHFESNRFTESDKDKYKDIVTTLGKDRIKGDGHMLLTKLAKAVRVRERQARKVISYAKRSGCRNVILAGDFNDTPTSGICRLMSTDFTDAYEASGNGPGFSFNKKFFFFRIDHIFCSGTLTPLRTWTDKTISFSDHYPMISVLEMQQKGSEP